MSRLSEAISAAKKILGDGDGIQIPKDKGGIDKDGAAMVASCGSMSDALDELSDKLLDLKKATDTARNSAQAVRDEVDGATFDLNSKDSKQKKQLADAQQCMFDVLDPLIDLNKKRAKLYENIYKSLSSVNKQLNQAKQK